MRQALAVFAALAAWLLAPIGRSASLPLARDPERANFAPCRGPVRVTCVVDGDTFWYRGIKIRLADINAPELSAPRCRAEAGLAARATARLVVLLNVGAFSLQSADRAADVYGRRLAVVSRRGASLGLQLAGEGLAERWRGHRRDWC